MSSRNLVRLKYLAGINERSLPEQTDPEQRIRYIDISLVGYGYLVGEPKELRFKDAPSSARRLVRDGDTIISTVRAYLRAVWQVDGETDDLVVSTGFAVLTPMQIEPRFFSWWVRSDRFIEEMVARSVGVLYPTVSALELGDLQVRMPATSEQRAIADYLDTETARIDALITKKRRLIDLLNERRLACVSHNLAGLGYPVLPLKRIADVAPSNVDKLSVKGELPVRLVNYTDVYYGDRLTSNMDYMRATATPAEVAKFHVRPGDVIMTKDSETADDIGIPAFVDSSAPDLICGYHLSLVRPRTVLGRYLYFAISSTHARDQMSVASTGVTRFALRSESIKLLSVRVPPLSKQRAIADYLDTETARIDALITKKRRLIDLLAERRQALITAAVTGKLEIPEVAA